MKNKFLIGFLALVLLSGLVTGVILSSENQKNPVQKSSQVVENKAVEKETADVREPVVSDNHRLKIAYSTTSRQINTLLSIGDNKQFFKKNNLELIKIAGQNNTVNQLVTGEVDVEMGTLSEALKLYFDNNDVRWLASTFNPSSYGVSRFPKAQSGRIKTVAITETGGIQQAMAESALKKMGASLDNITLTVAQDDLAKARLLQDGAIDFAAIESESVISNMKLREKYTVLNASELYNSPILETGIFTTRQAIIDKKVQLNNFISAINETITYIINNQQEVVKGLIEKNKLSPDKAERIYDNILMSYRTAQFVPDEKRLKTVSATIKGNQSVSEQNLSNFMYPDFAKTVSKKSSK